MQSRFKSRGAILIESLLVLTLVWIPLTVLEIEMIQAATTRFILHQASFDFAREVGFGRDPKEAHRIVVDRWAGALFLPERRHFSRFRNWFVENKAKYLEAGVSIRFPTMIPIFQDRRRSTSRCRFYFR